MVYQHVSVCESVSVAGRLIHLTDSRPCQRCDTFESALAFIQASAESYGLTIIDRADAKVFAGRDGTITRTYSIVQMSF